VRSRTAARQRSLVGSLGPWIAGASLTALLAAVGGLVAPPPAFSQSLEYQPPRPDADGDYGANLEPFEADGPLMAVVSLGSQQIRVFDRNGLVANSKVSTGRKGHDTPEGIFSIIERKVEHRSNLYDDAEMPFMQRLTWSGIALHQGALPGYRASHGCIRLPEGFAEQLFRTTRIATRVVIVPHDATPQSIAHPVLPQPGDPPAIPAPQPAEPDMAVPSASTRQSGAITMVATAEDANIVRDAATSVEPAKPQPGLAELRARRIAVEKRLAAATTAVNQAKVPVRPRLIEQGKTEKALRQAIALANRAEGRAEVMGKAPFETAIDADRDGAVTDHIEALVELVAARAREGWARELAARSAAATMSAQDEVRKLDAERQVILNQYRSIARRLSPVTIFVSRDAGRVYVHRAFHPVMDLPIEIRDSDRRIGTHIFTAHQIDDRDDALRWVGLTLETADGRSPPTAERAKPKSRRAGESGEVRSSGDSLRSARAALDRVELPPAILARIMPTLQPGSTVIISDLGKSIESGPGTDIVVQTRGEAEAARSIANFAARKRAESFRYSETSYKPRRRDWERW
jgi:hypothetical protein